MGDRNVDRIDIWAITLAHFGKFTVIGADFYKHHVILDSLAFWRQGGVKGPGEKIITT
jgi:hypothetical protein